MIWRDLLRLTGAAGRCGSPKKLPQIKNGDLKMTLSSTIDAGPAPTKSRASALQRYMAWLPTLLGVLLALLGLILAAGGAYLAALGGSLYYVLVGATLL